jgi:hypothetical protein
MSAALGFVPADDGYTEEARINERPGLHPALTFRFRRMTSEDFADFLQQASKLDERQITRLMGAHLAGRLKSWDLKGPDGQVFAITADNVRRLVRTLFVRLWSCVAGMEAPDALVQSEQETAADLEDALAAAESGRPVALVREERLRKNSLSGSGSS